MARTLIASDDFNRAGPDVGANWQQLFAFDGACSIQGATTIKGSGQGNMMRWNGAGTFANDQYSKATVVTFGGVDTSAYRNGVLCRAGPDLDDGGSTTRDYYEFIVQDVTARAIELAKVVNGTRTILNSAGSSSFANGDTIELEVTGSGASTLLTGYRNGVSVLTATDTAGAHASGKPGVLSSDAQAVDNWEGGDVTLSSLEQEGYRWRADDGSETTATWLAAQDSNITRATATNTRLRGLINATNDPATAQYQLEYKLSSDSVYKKVEAAGGGAVAFGTIGTVTTTGTTAPTVAYPASIAAGDLLILAIANRPNANTPATPSGWTAGTNNTTTGGAGSEAAGTGTVRITVFYKIADGTETGNLTLSITSGTSCGAAIWRCTKTTGKDWAPVLANGSDNSAGTGWSVTFGSDPGVTAGDLVFVASASSEDTATFASQAITQTGMTYGTMTERADTAIATGNDLRLIITEHAVTSGTSAAAAVYVMTASGTNAANSAGASIMIRLRQVNQPIQLSASANITASGENTTAQLTAPSGKSTSDFVTGRMQDDENPADTVDITTDDYSEFEWCLTATASASNGQIYDFRMTAAGTALNTYTLTPQWTIGTPSAGFDVPRNSWLSTAVNRAANF